MTSAPKQTTLAPGAFVVEKDGKPVTIYEPLPHQRRFHESTARFTLLSGGRGSGKAVSLDTVVVTPFGYAPMRDIQVGDEVMTPAGTVTRVVWKSDTHVDPLGTYRLTFDDGTDVVCGASHEWVTTTAEDRRKASRANPAAWARRRATRADRGGKGLRPAPDRPHKWRTEAWVAPTTPRTTQEIAATLVVDRGKPHTNHAVAVSASWDLPEVPLPIPPYTFGAWLGDGAAMGGAVSGLDEEVFEGMASEGFPSRHVPSCDGRTRRVEGLTTALAAIGLGYAAEKRIPREYLWGSYAQRLAFLQGLMDTDGCCGLDGTVEFCNTNRELADAVLHLATSLGAKANLAEGRATLYGKDCGPKYRVTWTASVPVFRIQRKLARLQAESTLRGVQRRRFIVAAEKIDDVPVQCIQVADASHQYLITDRGIATHNSLAMRMEAIMMAFAIPNFRALILRRSAPELKKSHLMELPMELAKMGLPKDAFHVTDMVLRIPGNHSIVQFGHVEDDHALTKWLSSQWTALYIDELTTFSYTQFTWLLTSLRSTIPGMVTYCKCGTNPVGPGSGFVRDLWITKDAAQNPDQYPGYNPDDYYNIPANLDDNPYLDPVSYGKLFEGIPSQAIRDALRHGIWSIEGQAFPEWAPKRDDKPWHVIPELPTYKGRSILEVKGIEVFRAIDWGFSDYGCALWFAAMFDGSLVVFDELLFKGLLPREVAEEMRRRSEGMKVRYTVADPAMWAEHEGPSIAEHMERAGVPMIEGDRQRKPGWIMVHQWLRDTVNDGVSERPKLRIVGHKCPYITRTFPQMVVDDKDVEDIKTKGVEDHGVDVIRYALMSRPSASKFPTQDPVSAQIFRDLFRTQTRSHRLGSEATHR